jgi:hypothetical protein
MEFLNNINNFARISRMNKRFASSTIMTLLIFLFFKTSKIQCFERLSDLFLIKIAAIKKNDNFSFAVGLILYTKNQHQRANDLFGSIRCFRNLTPKALYLISLCSSWQMNLNTLRRIEFESANNSIKFFVRGLISHNSSPSDSIDSFTKVLNSYLAENPEDTEPNNYPEYVKNSINVSKPLPQVHTVPPLPRKNGLLSHLETDSLSNLSLPSDVSDLILISYTSSYLLALSDSVIERIRRSNHQRILLIVSISYLENKNTVLSFCQHLSLKYGGISWKIVHSNFDLPVLSSVIRIVIAQEILDNYSVKSILILDGDTSFRKVDPIRLWNDIDKDFDIALLQNQSLCPWERMSLGFTILNNTANTKRFLLQFDLYVTTHILKDRAFWTLDQTAAFLVLQSMLQSDQDLGISGVKVFDLSSIVSLRDFIFTDKSLIKLKLSAKISNRDFVSGMSEPLYYP